MRIHIQGGRLIDPANQRDGLHDVYISEGRIASIDNAPPSFHADKVINAQGQIVCPGLVDLRAQLREPGEEHKATIASEVQAAVAGGITSLCCPPDTLPPTETPAVVKLIQQRAHEARKNRVYVLGALTQGLAGEQLSEMAALKDAGVRGISNGLQPVTNPLVMRRAMEYAATYDLKIYLHPEDQLLRNHGCMHEGIVSTRLGLPGIPEAAETVAVARDLALVAQTGIHAHFCHLSTARAVRMIARAQHDKLPVTADVAAHHLHLTEMDVGNFNSLCHVIPPLRTQRDRDGLREGLARGTISAICSDHQPHEPDAKLAPFCNTEPGISALETLLPLSLRLADEGVIPLSAVIACLTCNPAQILGIDAGHLSPGAKADVCIFDPECYWDLTPQTLLSRGKNSPFLGWQLKGRVSHTLYAGHIVFSR